MLLIPQLTIPENQWQQDDKDKVDIEDEKRAHTEPADGGQVKEEGTGVSVLESVKILQELPTHPQGTDWLETHQSVGDVGEDRTLGLTKNRRLNKVCMLRFKLDSWLP